MKIILNEMLNHFSITKGKDMLVKQHIIQGESFDDVFRQVYECERSSRYDNYRWYEFVDLDVSNSYLNWKRYNETIEMYYGNSVVD